MRANSNKKKKVKKRKGKERTKTKVEDKIEYNAIRLIFPYRWKINPPSKLSLERIYPPPHPFVNESTTKLRKQSSEGTIAGLLFVNGPPVNDT